MKKEDEERRRQEEEEARLKQEAEENERLDIERAEKEARTALENEERKRRKGQLLELEELWLGNRNRLLGEAVERRKNARWERYMLCDGSPDPTIQREINTYMNLWREVNDSYEINAILEESKLALRLINELIFILKDTPSDELSESEAAAYKATKCELQELLQGKLDLASHDMLLKATKLADPETMNLQKVVSDSVITLCCWGNLSKNPRIKSFEFNDMGVTFEIPKVLSLSDCAVRILFTEYDHYSQLCRTYTPRVKKYVEPTPEEKPAEGEEGEKKEGEEGEEKEEGEEGEKTDMEKEDTEDVLKELEDLGDDEEGGEKEEEATNLEPAEPVEDEYELKTPAVVEWEDFDGDEDVIDLRAYSVMGPVFHLDLLQLPPQPKQAQDWVMTIIEGAQLTPLDYMVDVGGAPPSAQSNRENNADSDSHSEEKSKREEKPPITISMKLPPRVYFCEEPQVARWDHDSKEWRLEGFSDHVFDEEKKMLTFKTSVFGTLALLQDSHINMPFQSWEIRPRGPNHAMFTLIAAIVEVELEIKDGDCQLVIPEDRPELEHFRDKWIPTKEMIHLLKLAGIHVFPQQDSHKYVSVQSKNGITEERLYQQMAMTASTMAYSWSKWNAEVANPSQIVFQGCEHLEDEPLLEEDWSLFLVTKLRTTNLKMTEFDEAFSEDYKDGTEFHADLYHMSLEITSDSGSERIRGSTYQFIDSVYTILSSVKVLTYA